MVLSDRKFVLLLVSLIIIILFMGNGIISFAVSNRVANRFIGELGSRIEFLEKQQALNVRDIKTLKAEKVSAELFVNLISIVYDQNQILRDMGEAARIQDLRRYNTLLDRYESLNVAFQIGLERIRKGSE